MPGPAQNLRRALLSALAIGALLMVWSELWFHRVDRATLGLLWLGYTAAAGLVVTGVAACGVRRWDGLVLAAALMGFALEGALTTGLYAYPPLSYLWTALIWHGALSFGVGVVIYRRVMVQGSWLSALGLNMTIGAALGIWNAYAWTAVPGTGTTGPVFRWALAADVPEQFVLGFVIFLVAHLVLDLLAQTARTPVEVPLARELFLLLCGLGVGLYGLSTLPGAYPRALALLPLAGLCIWGMARHGRRGPSPVLDAVLGQTIPLPRYGLSLILPATAVVTVSLMADLRIGLQANALAILIAGPIGLVLVLRAIARGLRHPA